MADLHHYQQQQHQEQQQNYPNEGSKSFLPQNGPSASQVVAVATLVPIGGTLLFLAGLTLVGTIIVLALSAPLFVIFSPVLVPAALVIGLAVTGILTSGAFGITALSSFHWLANYLGRIRFPEQMELAKHRLQETAGDLGHKAKETVRDLGQKTKETAGDLGQKTKETAGDLSQKTKETGQNVQLKAQEGETGRAQVNEKRGRAHEGIKT